ncbi:hypothetical protein BD413DRAFT_475046 [Trametes elegans]|nr:hypothetical protein BD413DRAFT_475046 [Trametes elegans]
MPEDTSSATQGPSQETVSSISSTHVLSDAPSSASRGRGKRKAKEPQWSLEFHSPPQTMEVQRGRIPFQILAELLHIDEEARAPTAAGHLGVSLKTMPGFDIRIYNESDIAFLYQPVILEGPKVTYLIGWGNEEMVRRRESWAKTLGDMHLFTCPDKVRDPGWHYIGLHSLTFARLDNVWSKLQKEDKQKLQAQLKERNPGLDTGGFRRDVREGRLVQCCLQLESKGKAESLDFLSEYGLLGSEG